ncbi:MAG: hypothetical protein WB780_22365 [Candidatus Acidiferrales bacterium]
MTDIRTIQERLAGRQLSELEQKIRECRDPTQLQNLVTASQTLHGSFTRNPDGSVSFESDYAETNAPHTSLEKIVASALSSSNSLEEAIAKSVSAAVKSQTTPQKSDEPVPNRTSFPYVSGSDGFLRFVGEK